MFLKHTTFLIAIGLVVLTAGCSTVATSNTPRTAKEQMLLSNAVDQSFDKVDFTPLYGQQVFLDDKYLECTDKAYVMGSLRHRIMRAGGTLAATADAADVIMEVRSGGVGTDLSDAFVGIPAITLPGMLTLPEIRMMQRKTQNGYAKIGLVLFDAKSKSVLGDGGMSMAQSEDSNWFVLGMGPWQNGTLKGDVETSRRIPHGMKTNRVPTQVAFEAPNHAAPGDVRYAGGAEGEKK